MLHWLHFLLLMQMLCVLLHKFFLMLWNNRLWWYFVITEPAWLIKTIISFKKPEIGAFCQYCFKCLFLQWTIPAFPFKAFQMISPGFQNTLSMKSRTALGLVSYEFNDLDKSIILFSDLKISRLCPYCFDIR